MTATFTVVDIMIAFDAALTCTCNTWSRLGVGWAACVWDDIIKDSIIKLKFLYFSSDWVPTGAVWKSKWPSWVSILMSLTVSVDVKQHWTMLRHWSQFVPNMATDIRGHEAPHHHHDFIRYEASTSEGTKLLYFVLFRCTVLSLR